MPTVKDFERLVTDNPIDMELFKKTFENVENSIKIIKFAGDEDEIPEKAMIWLYLPSNSIVLEIGGNIGRCASIISKILDDDSNLVVVETIKKFAEVLKTNRDNNGMHFNIVEGAITRTQLCQTGWYSRPCKRADSNNIKSYTFEEIQKSHDLTFNVLVVDCEACFGAILDSEIHILDNINTIFIEHDELSKNETTRVSNFFTTRGFRIIAHLNLGDREYFFTVYSKHNLRQIDRR